LTEISSLDRDLRTLSLKAVLLLSNPAHQMRGDLLTLVELAESTKHVSAGTLTRARALTSSYATATQRLLKATKLLCGIS